MQFCQEQIGASLTFSALNLNLIVASNNIAEKWCRRSGRPLRDCSVSRSDSIAPESSVEKTSMRLVEQEFMLLINFSNKFHRFC
jgi:hypothetical protein